MSQARQDEPRLIPALVLLQAGESCPLPVQEQIRGRSGYEREGMASAGADLPRRPRCRGQQPPPPATFPELCLAPGLLGEPR